MKNERILSLLVIMFLSLCVHAQSYYNQNLLGQWVDGYIITSTNETVKGKIAYQHFAANQTNITFSVDGTAAKSEIFRPGDLLEYFMQETHWLSTKNTTIQAEDNEDLFVLMVRQGPVSLYEYYLEDAEASGGWKTISLIKKLDENYHIAGNMLLGFKKKMSKYVSDFEELSRKINDKEKGYKVLNMNKIIDEYNARYLESHPDFTLFRPIKVTEKKAQKIEWMPVQTYEGVETSISSSYRKEPTWSGFTEEDVEIAIDLKVENKSEKSFQQIVIEFKMLDAEGKVLMEGKSFVGYTAFSPKVENEIKPGYIGVSKAWKSERGEKFKKSWVKTEYKVIELK
jgi:hypothetical protein